MTVKEISRDVLRILGHTWCAPLTIFGLIYALVFTTLGWYSWDSRQGSALVFNTSKMPQWLEKLWRGWAGHTVGHVVVLSVVETRARSITLRHEQEHIAQMMRLGVFHPVIYLIIMGVIKLSCKNIEPYKMNVFEIDARRAAGQPVDL